MPPLLAHLENYNLGQAWGFMLESMNVKFNSTGNGVPFSSPGEWPRTCPRISRRGPILVGVVSLQFLAPVPLLRVH